MSESQFNELIDSTFAALEQALDAVDADLDYETSGGVLTVAFDNSVRSAISLFPRRSTPWRNARSTSIPRESERFNALAVAFDWLCFFTCLESLERMLRAHMLAGLKRFH